MGIRHLLLTGMLLLTFVGSNIASTATSLLMPKPHQLTENGMSFALNRNVTINDPTRSTLLASLFSVRSTQSDAPSPKKGRRRHL